MVRHVHIIPVGTNPQPVLEVIKSDIPVHRVYLICADTSTGKVDAGLAERLAGSEAKVTECLRLSGIRDVRSVRVDSWDYQMTLDKVLDLAAAEREEGGDVSFHINFTSGTHVICGAVSCSAFFIGADLYYVMNTDEHDIEGDPVRRFPIPSIPDVSRIKENTRHVLSLLEGGGWVPNGSLISSTGMTPSKLGYHTRILREYGLAEKRQDGKHVFWRLTYSGNVALRVMGRPMTRVPGR